ncbi:cypemycin methyltransferase [mine drainage metagenome]|uniref:Cypemycin methyltransferase n=1 Tax=mine drainage metagenome TaxID=410659 RepID=A0A1J5QGE6_9ZZZZ
MGTNPYSAHWFRSFCVTVPPEWTRLDVEGLSALLPFSEFGEVLDIGCGTGRVAGPLADLGYHVTGIDSSPEAIATAKRLHPNASFIEVDQRDLDQIPSEAFDSCLVLWHSFGYFTSYENELVLNGIRRRLRLGGRVVFDLFNPEYARLHTGKQQSRGLDVISAETSIREDRLTSTIDYIDGHRDRIEFQIYEPAVFTEICRASGLQVTQVLSNWKPVDHVSREHVRYQMVLEAIEA